MIFKSQNMQELSKEVSLDTRKNNIHYNSYGRYLEDFKEGMVFEHPRGISLTPAFMYDFAMTFFEANPLYINKEYALTVGFRGIPASPLLIMNIILSLGVQNNSEKAYANLGYYDMCFLRPVYAGDTLRAFSKITKRKERGKGEPGIIILSTIGLNQNDERVIQYKRKIMVLPRPERARPEKSVKSTVDIEDFSDEADINIPDYDPDKRAKNLTGKNTYYEDFSVGDVISTHNGRSISDEHFAWASKLGNTHPLHFDRVFTRSLRGTMGGEPVVYGGLIFAWLLGLASRDISENALWDLGYTEGYHTQPTKTGDTVHVIHRVVGEEKIDSKLKIGIKQFQVIGLKNMLPKEAIEKYGADLFLKESNKKKPGKKKIFEKIFEIERRLLLFSRD